MTIAVTIILLILVWVFLDLYLGRKKAKTKAVERCYPVRQSHISFFCSGTELFEQLYTDIRQAKESIYTLFYIIENDDFSKEYLQLLKEKADEGVKIYLLMDWLGSRKVPKFMLKELKNSGVCTDFFGKPKFPFLFFSLQQRNHRKITVIDHQIGYLGGFNVGREYINQHKNPMLCPWRDYHLRLTGEGVADLEQEFLHDWNQEGRPQLNKDSQVVYKDSQEAVNHQIFPSQNGVLEKKFAELISEAKDFIFIGSPYFVPSKLVFSQLMQAIERGVKVTALIPKHADHPLVKEGSYPFLRQMLANENVEIYQFQKGFYHAKVLMVDDRVCDIGTANFDERSFSLNFECNCFIYSPEFMEKIKPVIQKDIKNSYRLTQSDLERTSWVGKIKENIAFVLRPYL
ncbi:cardiolipin synthase [Bacillus ectoiniformans]|uniref:cardiolipin synthase n=1 Tax=Bacillus ectoiniformans TaxID=1494429 RepID=UPI00195A9B5A|nr:cardiolipin synthase [Bacillus ectoiniformans]MBM7648326.1 cardiolipin synthase [Bacillus ectoiniformans]